MGRLDGKVAVVTGASVGIGATAAKVFAQEGAAVVLTGRRKELLEQVSEEIERTGGRALVVPGSVTDEAHVRLAVSQAVRTFGKLTVLVNNAGIGEFGQVLHETDDASWHAMLDVNLTGVFRFIRAAVPEMLQGGGGSIINISSIAGSVGLPLSAAYSATKGGIDALTRAIAVEYADAGIRCNAVSPGLIETPMAEPLLKNPDRLAEVLRAYPIARPGKPEEVAHLLVYLASDESRWMTGANIPIDGGMTAQ
jgi:NAD(P)-dependent dehydrogenase (short-subunit alcohol dehydrogenase family)